MDAFALQVEWTYGFDFGENITAERICEESELSRLDTFFLGNRLSENTFYYAEIWNFPPFVAKPSQAECGERNVTLTVFT